MGLFRKPSSRESSDAGSGGGDFWKGVAVGGVGGYLLGKSKASRPTYRDPNTDEYGRRLLQCYCGNRYAVDRGHGIYCSKKCGN